MLFEIALALTFPLLLVILYNYIQHLTELKDYPPGPFPLPVIGNLHQVGTKAHLTLKEMAKTYGDVFSVSFGSERVLVLNTIEPTKEALITRGKAYANRPKSYVIELLSRGYKNMSFTDFSPLYNTMRKTSHSALKMFCDGNRRLEFLVVEESEYLHQRLRILEGKPVAVHFEIGLSVLNVICAIVFGHRYKAEDPEYKEMLNFTNLVFQGLACCDAVAIFPWLRHFPLDGITKLKAGLKIRDRLYRKKIQYHKDTYDPDHIRDCTDAILKALSEEEILKKSNLEQNSSNDNAEMLVNDLFVGGLETTTTVLRWAILFLLHWPQYQDQIHKEMKKIVGYNRYPDMNDRPNMDLTQAFIQETLRFASVTPLNVPRRTTENTEVGGYSVPKNTQVLFNLWNIHRDPRHWTDPELFNPQRFLDTDGKYVTGSYESFLPFSAGRRVCFGEIFAKMELFLLLSRLIRDYSVHKAPGEKLPSLEGELGITLTPPEFNVLFKARNNNSTS